MGNMRTMAFQVPEELFQRIKGYLQRNHISQKQFVLGLIETELDREQAERENMDTAHTEPEDTDEEVDDLTDEETDEESEDEDAEEEETEAEAEIVRLIFDLYLQGLGSTKIAATLNEMDIPRRKDCHKWRSGTVLYIIDNERYMGDALLQKKYTTETLPFKQKKNRGEHAQYYVENSNPAIVSREMFEAVRRLRTERRTNDGYKKADYPLSRILRCPECGRAFRRQIVNGTAYWQCAAKSAGETDCQSRRLREDAVYEAFTEMTWKLKRHHSELLGTLIRQLEQMQNRNSAAQEKIRAIDKSIADLAAQNLVVTRLHTKGILELADYTAQTDEINRKIRDLRIDRRQILAEDETDEMIDTLKELESIIDESHPGTDFDEELFGEIVESITVNDSTQITFKLMGGVMLTEKIHKKGRCNVA